MKVNIQLKNDLALATYQKGEVLPFRHHRQLYRQRNHQNRHTKENATTICLSKRSSARNQRQGNLSRGRILIFPNFLISRLGLRGPSLLKIIAPLYLLMIDHLPSSKWMRIGRRKTCIMPRHHWLQKGNKPPGYLLISEDRRTRSKNMCPIHIPLSSF